MAHTELVSPRARSLLTSDRFFLVAGLAVTFAALLLSQLAKDRWVEVRAGLILVGLITVGGAISTRLQSTGWGLEERSRSAGFVALGGLAALVAYPAVDRSWDTARLLLAVLAGVALVGAGLILLPTLARKIALSLLLLYHFGGILMAVTSVAPPNNTAPWMTLQIWTRVYRPYLQFMYLNNAYHFYSPEPGPPILLWFYIEYQDGSSRWVTLPNREDFRTQLEYQRRLAKAESTNMLLGQSPRLDELWQRRWLAGQEAKPPIPPYPFHLMLPNMQHREPTPFSKLMIASYARHVARNYPNPTDPSKEVVGVKVYRVVHRMLFPGEFADGKDPIKDPTMYQPYYQGEFDRDGNLLDPDDPFLYWAIPIMDVPKQAPPGHFRVVTPHPQDTERINFCKVHAERVKTKRKPQDRPGP